MSPRVNLKKVRSIDKVGVFLLKLTIMTSPTAIFVVYLATSISILGVYAIESDTKVTEMTLSSLEAPVGTLEFASMHEAGHVVAAKSVGLAVSGATVFQLSKPGIGLYWKGTTRIRGKGRGMAVAKLGGNFAGFFLDANNRFCIPSFLDIVGSRSAISRTDSLTAADLGGGSLSEAQYRTYRALSANAGFLNRVYLQLKTKKSYP